MLKPFDFCLPTKSTSVPSAPDGQHKIKYDGIASGWSATATACAWSLGRAMTGG